MLVSMVLVAWLLLFAWCLSVFVLMVCMGRFGTYSGCGWVCNGCVGFISWLEWCLVVWMGCRMGGRWCRSVHE